ncbi:MAG: isopeptide-forming domain-containing fimbrial protein [Ruminococcaceae bacterium]|nr:isopeptide-forming domain-containing fimbrial protein [Oscillospiraceae bacterium]
MKKLFAVLLALTLVLSMGTIALAADTGTITIENALEGATYNIYKMLSFTPSNTTGDKGIYTVEAGWEDFFTKEPATNYFDYTVVDKDTDDERITVDLKDGVTEVDQTLAKAAIQYAKDNSIAATETKTASGDLTDPETGKEVKFENLALGYYAIDTSLGTLCALTNTNSDFKATEKNEKPDIDKFVQEDSEMTNADEGWGKVNDADIDQQVNYKSTITVGVGATNYVMHDTMEAGLTFNNDVVVKLADGTAVDAANYTVVYPATDGHTFDVKFENSFIAGLAKGTQFTVYYSATLNENANIVTDGNDNTVYLSYGEDSTWETAEHKTTTYTWKMDVLKFAKDGETQIKLAGAKFQLLGADGKAIKFSEVTGAAVPTYKVDKDGAIDTITTDANGKFELVGLDEGAYKLHETEAPAGYNKLAADLDVVITSTYDEDALTAAYKINNADPATIEVENKTGGLLPETGGIGTTIFYVVGIVMMLGAGIVLISKKRMASFA